MSTPPPVTERQQLLLPLPEKAWTRFCAVYERASALVSNEPNAVCLATADAHGQPSVRVVLLKDVTAAGFVFYTNSMSRKGTDLKVNPRAALCFFWDTLMEQVRVEGNVEQLPDKAADDYFSTRARDSQISAWASLQSQQLPSHTALKQRVVEYEASYKAKVPRPPHWLGYQLRPFSIEFWQVKPARLHQRDRYSLSEGVWTHELLYP